MKLSRTDLRLAKAACKDDCRPVLTNVLLRDERLLASDGFLLVTKRVRLEAQDTLRKDEDVFLPRAMLNRLKPGPKETAEVEIDGNNYRAIIRRNCLSIREPILLYSVPKPGGKFLDLSNISIPPRKQAEVAVNIELLRDLLNCLPSKGTLKIGVGSKTDPVEFSIVGLGDPEPVRGAMMPMYVEWENHKWIKDLPEFAKKEEAIVEPSGADSTANQASAGG